MNQFFSHMTVKYNLFTEMPLDFSSDCECPNCLENIQNVASWNPCSTNSDESLHLRQRDKSTPSSSVQSFSSQGCSARPEEDTKEDSVFLPLEEESYIVTSENNDLGISLEGLTKKIRPLRELTVQELLREFGDSRKFQPNSVSVGHFRDQVVMKFRRALYYSGIWVAYVQGYRFEKHLSANYFKRNPGCLHRLVPWLKRELTAVYGDYGYTVKTILSTILHHMTKYDLDSDSFINLLEPYLQQHTHHFLHEFISFVHSPYNMETYDQRAIYQFSSVSPWVEKKSVASAPVLPLPKDQDVLPPQHDIKHFKNTQGQWNNEQRPLPGMKAFPNGNSCSKKSEVPLLHHKAGSKIHAWLKDKSEPGDLKVTPSTNSTLLNSAILRERSPGLLNCKKHVKERKTERIKLFPGQAQDVGMSETMARTFSSPAILNQGQPRKNHLREKRALNVGQQINFQKKEAEKNKCSDSSPRTFQRLPRERSLINCKSRKRDPSWSCISETAVSSKRDGRKLNSFREKRMKYRQPFRFAEVGSHCSRGIQRQSRSNTQNSKSWCAGLTNRSISREASNPSLRGSHRRECFTQNMRCELSKENKAHAYESNYGRPSSVTIQYMKFHSNIGKRTKCPLKSEDSSQAGSHCNSPTCLQIQKLTSASKQEMKHKKTFPSATTRTVRPGRNKYHCLHTQTTEEVSDETGELNDLRQKSSLSECVPSCRRQMQNEKENPSLQKHHQAKSEQKGDRESETHRCKSF